MLFRSGEEDELGGLQEGGEGEGGEFGGHEWPMVWAGGGAQRMRTLRGVGGCGSPPPRGEGLGEGVFGAGLDRPPSPFPPHEGEGERRFTAVGAGTHGAALSATRSTVSL